jgi:hypothetical protein
MSKTIKHEHDDNQATHRRKQRQYSSHRVCHQRKHEVDEKECHDYL